MSRPFYSDHITFCILGVKNTLLNKIYYQQIFIYILFPLGSLQILVNLEVCLNILDRWTKKFN